MALSRPQKKKMLTTYLENEMSADATQIALTQFFEYLNVPIVINVNNGPELLKNVLKTIPATEISDLMYEIYDELNDKHYFDDNNTKCKALILGLEKLYINYATLLQEQADKKAWNSTVWYSLFLVTIPFATQFYKNKQLENHLDCHIKPAFVDYESMNKRDAREGRKHVYGLMDKHKANIDKPFKEILFSKKNQIRKFVPAHERGLYGGRGIYMFSTKAQLQAAARKFVDNNPEQEQTHANTITRRH